MDKKDLEKAFENNNGVLKTSQLTALKIHSTDIKRFIKNGIIEKIKTRFGVRGYDRTVLSPFVQVGVVCIISIVQGDYEQVILGFAGPPFPAAAVPRNIGYVFFSFSMLGATMFFAFSQKAGLTHCSTILTHCQVA
jgi:hypothetical protein